MSVANYTIRIDAGKPNKAGEVRIYIRVNQGGRYHRVPTTIRVHESFFEREKVIKHPLAKSYNEKIALERIEVERKLLAGIPINDKTNHNSFKEVIEKHFEETIHSEAVGTRKSKKSSLAKILEWKPGLRVSNINAKSLQEFENYLWTAGQDRNTINKRLVHFKMFCKIAKVKREYWEEYFPPSTMTKIPIHLTEKQINDFEEVVLGLKQHSMQIAGYYFLLACYAGYRMSDLKAFDYEKYVREGQLIVRAKKNGAIVSIPMYPKLKRVVEWCKDNPPNIEEQTIRRHVKTIATAANIKQHVKVHTGRHSFACLMLTKGLDVFEVAELLGDSLEVARIYARITNKNLSDKINKLMG